MVITKKSFMGSLTKLIFWVCCTALILSFVIFSLEKFQVIDLYNKPLPVIADSSSDNPVNTINYSPPTEQEKSDPTTKPSDTPKDSPINSSSSTIGVVLSAAGQDINGGPVVVRSIINNANGGSGSCSLSIAKDSVVRTYSALVVWQGTYYSCAGFDIPFTDVSAGVWDLKLSVKQDQNSGESSQQITVKAAL